MYRFAKLLPTRRRGDDAPATRRPLVECLEGRRLLSVGLQAQYFDNPDLTAPRVSRVDPTVNFDWGAGSPDSSVGPDDFSARWTGKLLAPITDTWTFRTATDDGVRLWVNNQLLIDGWGATAGVRTGVPIWLQQGQTYDIKMEYMEHGGGAAAQLRWTTPRVPEEVIPPGWMQPTTPPAVSTPASTPPKPTNLKAAASGGAVQLTWTDRSKSELGFRIERKSAGGSYQQIATAPTDATSFLDTSVSANVTYTYRVRAFNQVGPSGSSNEASAKVRAGTSGPSIAWADGPAGPVARVEPGGIQVGSKLFIFGGYRPGDFGIHTRLDVFDMASQTWSTRGYYPAPQTHAAMATDGRYVYMAGGQYGGGIPGTPSNELWRYDTVSDAWERLPPLPDYRYGGTMQYLNGKLYFFGGNPRDRVAVAADLWVLDLGDAWAGWSARTPLPLAGDHISSAVIAGKIYAVGGEEGHAATLDQRDALYIQHPYLLEYDPAADRWTRKADLPFASSHAEASTIVVNNKIVVLGGQIDGIQTTAGVRSYDPQTNRWSTLTRLPDERKGTVAGYYNGKIYVTGGQRDGDWTIYANTWVGTVQGL